jgi:hypothetical protein
MYGSEEPSFSKRNGPVKQQMLQNERSAVLDVRIISVPQFLKLQWAVEPL